jgi:hypothetical protein
MSKVSLYSYQTFLGLECLLVEHVVVVWGLYQLLLLQLVVLQHWNVHGFVCFEGW